MHKELRNISSMLADILLIKYNIPPAHKIPNSSLALLVDLPHTETRRAGDEFDKILYRI